MGRFGIFGAAALIAVGISAIGPVEAQTRTLRNTNAPAEIPPSSFTGAQYVDSNGCVFIRAGVNGATRWVPRVNRDRTVVCGAQPSLAQAPETAPVATATATPAPTVITPEPTVITPAPTVRATEPVIRRTPAPATPRTIEVAAPVVVAPPQVTTPRRTAPRPAVAPRPMPQVVRAPAPQVTTRPPGCGASELSARYLPGCRAGTTAARPTTRSVAVSAPTVATVPSLPRDETRRLQRTQQQVILPVATPPGAVRVSPSTPSPRRAQGTGGCSGASALSSRYLQGVGPCGGNSGWTPGGSPRAAVGTTTTTTTSTRAQRVIVVPQARSTFDVTRPPPGYRSAWDDGRLNPERGPRTLQGDYQSQAIWTNETPRRLRPFVRVQR